MIYVICTNKVNKDNVKTFTDAAIEHARLSLQQDDGCIRFDISKYNEEYNEITFFEQWESKEMLDKHSIRCKSSPLIKIINENRYDKNIKVYEIL